MSRNPYATRSQVLATLGFLSYARYLVSPLWRSIRARVLDRDARTCIKCRQQAPKMHVHHTQYDVATMRGDTIQALLTACHRCHRRAERKAAKSGDVVERLKIATAWLQLPAGEDTIRVEKPKRKKPKVRRERPRRSKEEWAAYNVRRWRKPKAIRALDKCARQQARQSLAPRLVKKPA